MDPLEAIVRRACDLTASKAARHEAFGELVDQFHEVATYWAHSYLKDPMQAQDAVQEGFVVAYQQLHTLRDPNAFPGWFRQIIFTQCTRMTRNKRVDTTQIDDNSRMIANEMSPDRSLEEAELKARVVAAIEALPEKEQIVTRLFYLYGYSQKEISRVLSIPVTTVKKRLQYARGNLRGLLAAMFEPWVVEPQMQLKPIPIPVEKRPYPPAWQDHW